jgi:hypothetical protein
VWGVTVPENSSEQRKFMMQYTGQEAEKYAMTHADRAPARQITYSSEGIHTTPAGYPF